MNDYRVHPAGSLRSTCSMAAALVVAAALVGSEAMAHGTETHSGSSAEDVYCPHAQSAAKDALKSACKEIPKDGYIVQQWAPVSWEVSRCSSRQRGTDAYGNPEYWYRADWTVICGPYGKYDHNPDYHDPNAVPSNMKHSH